MKRFLVVGLLLAIPLVFSAQAGAAKPQSNKAKVTAHRIATLALDGSRIAYASGGRIYVWNVATGATSVVKGKYSNATHSRDASQVAIAGTRVAWITRQGFGNTEMSEKLYSASAGGPVHVRKQGYIFGREDSANAVGGWIAGVVGSGKVLAVSTWKSDHATISKGRLSLITPTKLRSIVTGPGAVMAEAAQGGHIAVLSSLAAWPADEPSTPTTEPSVRVYSSGGKLLRMIVLSTPVPPPHTCGDCVGYPSTIQNSLALSGNLLVVLTETNPETGPTPWTWTTTLQVYNWTTGALLHTWPISFKPWALNVAAPLAAYGRFAAVEGRRLHLVDLTSGEDKVIGPGLGSPAALGPKGLVYVARGHGQHGKLIFVPASQLRGLGG